MIESTNVELIVTYRLSLISCYLSFFWLAKFWWNACEESERSGLEKKKFTALLCLSWILEYFINFSHWQLQAWFQRTRFFTSILAICLKFLIRMFWFYTLICILKEWMKKNTKGEKETEKLPKWFEQAKCQAWNVFIESDDLILGSSCPKSNQWNNQSTQSIQWHIKGIGYWRYRSNFICGFLLNITNCIQLRSMQYSTVRFSIYIELNPSDAISLYHSAPNVDFQCLN